MSSFFSWLFLLLPLLAFGQKQSTIDSFNGAVACTVCQDVILIIGKVADNFIGLDTAKALVSEICIKLKLYPEVLCRGVVNEFAPEFVYIVDHLSKAERSELCGALLLCPHNNTAVNSVDGVPFSSSYFAELKETLQHKFLPPHVHNQKHSSLPSSFPVGKRSGNVGKFGQVTDIHIDPFYLEGSEVFCGLPVCCRRANGPGQTAKSSAPKFGSIEGSCDIPVVTFASALKSIASQNLDFLLVTGDYPAHDIWDQDVDRNLACSQIVATAFATELPETVGVFPLIGNHESFPINQFRGPGFDSWLYNGSANLWSQWLPKDALKTVEHSGYYSTLIRPGLRGVALNCPLWMKPTSNFWQFLPESVVWREDMLNWLVGVMADAYKNHERVFILTHVPYDELIPKYADAVLSLFEQYEDMIVASFGGHVHTDYWQVFKKNDATKRPIGIHFSSPSLTTYFDWPRNGAHHPCYRVFHYDTTSFELLDVETFYANITRANIEGKITWELAYSAAASYNMTGLRAADFQIVNDRLAADQTLFDAFFKNYHQQQVSLPGPVRTCDAKCKKDQLCTLNSITSEQHAACMKL